MPIRVIPPRKPKAAAHSARGGRILVVTSNFPRWQDDSTTPFVLTLAVDLKALGWEIDVVAPHAPGAERFAVMSGVNVYRFRYFWPERAQTVCYGGGTLTNLRQRPLEKLKLPALVFAEMFAVARMLARHRYEAVHAHWVLPQGFVCALLARLFRVPLVVTCHGSDLMALRGRLYQRFKRVALETANAVTTNSGMIDAAVREITPAVRRLERIPMSSEATIEASPARVDALSRRYRRDGHLLVTVGRLVPEKGIDDFIAAIASLGRADIRGVIVGDGQDRRVLEEKAARLGVADRIDFVGWASPEDVAAYLKAADIFVGLSKTGADGGVEGYGLTFVEAMYAGRPIVATRSGAISETVKHDVHGLLVPESAPDQAATAIAALLENPKRALTMGVAGGIAARRLLSGESAAEKFDALFLDLTRPTADIGERARCVTHQH